VKTDTFLPVDEKFYYLGGKNNEIFKEE